MEVTLISSQPELLPWGNRATGAEGAAALSAAETRSAPEGRALIEMVMDSLDQDKAEDVVLIELAGKSSMADAMVIASGRSTRQVGAIADNLARRLKEAGAGRVAVEGRNVADWILVDAGDIIVHLFRPEIRSFYNLEKMWGVEP